MNTNERYVQAKRITYWGAAANALMGIIKLLGGTIFHSHALIADGLHSFSDIATDAMVLIASKFGSEEADASHPYGHRRIETVGTFIVALLLVLAGGAIAWDALLEFWVASPEKPSWMSLPIALLSIGLNEFLFYYTKYIGHRIQSSLLLANAWHHRSDSAASAVVSLGILGSLMGFAHIDAAAAIIVGMMIIKMGVSYGWHSIMELVDTAIPPQLTQEIEEFIQQMQGVVKIHQLRSRSMGGDIFIDVHVQVEPFISVSEGHYIAQHVHEFLMLQIPKIKDVTVHIDPEDDEIACPSLHLPNRQELNRDILIRWQTFNEAIDHWVLHYLDGQLIIDLFCPSDCPITDNFRMHIEEDLTTMTFIKEVRIFRKATVIQAKGSNDQGSQAKGSNAKESKAQGAQAKGRAL